MEELKNIQLFLLDMDGTIYIDNKLIDGAQEFFETLINQKKNYVFLTNNSSKGVEQYLKKLKNLNIKANNENMFTSAQATAIFLKEKKDKASLYVVGTESLKKELALQGFIIEEDVNKHIDYLVVGYDTELNYEKLRKACYLLNRGIEYVATNPDLVCPTGDNEFIPDCGSICNMLKTATNREPIYIGKPRKEMVEIVSNMKKIPLENIAVVGDRLYTDIACGINAGVKSICVLTGETKKEDIFETEFKPSYVFNSIKDLYNIIK